MALVLVIHTTMPHDPARAKPPLYSLTFETEPALHLYVQILSLEACNVARLQLIAVRGRTFKEGRVLSGWIGVGALHSMPD